MWQASGTLPVSNNSEIKDTTHKNINIVTTLRDTWHSMRGQGTPSTMHTWYLNAANCYSQRITETSQASMHEQAPWHSKT